MHSLQVLLTLGLVFAASQAFAHPDTGGPCARYFESCKSDPSVTGAAKGKARMIAMHACIASAASADATNGPSCTAIMKKHQVHGTNANSTGAAPAAGN